MYCPNCSYWMEGGPTETWPNKNFHCPSCNNTYDITLRVPITVRHLVALIKDNKKIQAIKELRNDIDLGLRESKNIIDILGDAFTPPKPIDF